MSALTAGAQTCSSKVWWGKFLVPFYELREISEFLSWRFWNLITGVSHDYNLCCHYELRISRDDIISCYDYRIFFASWLKLLYPAQVNITTLYLLKIRNFRSRNSAKSVRLTLHVSNPLLHSQVYIGYKM